MCVYIYIHVYIFQLERFRRVTLFRQERGHNSTRKSERGITAHAHECFSRGGEGKKKKKGGDAADVDVNGKAETKRFLYIKTRYNAL